MTECISEGLYRIPVPLPGNPLRELNSYLLRGRERSLLIDTGFRQEEGRRALFAGLAELDVDPRDVDVALTHLHSDHSGLAPEVVGETGWIYPFPFSKQGVILATRISPLSKGVRPLLIWCISILC